MKTKPKITFAGADWKDTEGMAEPFIKFIKSKGFLCIKIQAQRVVIILDILYRILN